MKETTYVLGKEEFNVTFDTEGELRKISVNGTELKFTYRRVQPHVYVLFFEDGRNKTVYIAKDREKFYVWMDGQAYILSEKSEEYSASGAVKKEEGVQFVTSPMPGKVVKVLVKPDDKVKEGQGLIIVESMKMENEFTADFDGVVKEVNASPGEQIDADVPLVVVEALSREK